MEKVSDWGLSRPFDSNRLRAALSVGKSPITTSFWIWLLKCRQTAEMSANCRNIGTAQQAA
jgi:hypothetical protein